MVSIALLTALIASGLLEKIGSAEGHLKQKRLEKDGTFTNGERRVQRVRRVVNPPGEVRSDWEAICAVATSMGTPMAYQHPSEIMEQITLLTPPMAGISYVRLDEVGLQNLRVALQLLAR